MSVGSKWQESDYSKGLLKSSSFLLPEELKSVIKDSGISREYLAEKLGVTYNHLGRLINNIELRENKPAYEFGMRWVISAWAGSGDEQSQK
jgi:hypothetical protein